MQLLLTSVAVFLLAACGGEMVLPAPASPHPLVQDWIKTRSHPRAQLRTSVHFDYEVPTSLSLSEPVVVEFIIENGLEQQAIVDLGKNQIGHLKLTLERPDAKILTADLGRPNTVTEEMYNASAITIEAGKLRRADIVLDEWFGSLDQVGLYRLHIHFGGSIRSRDGQIIQVPRDAGVDFQITPRNTEALRTICLRLATIARLTNDPYESRAAVKELSYVKDPIAIESLQRVIERRKTLEMLDVEEVAIRALARMGTKEAHEALVSARSHTRLATMREIDQVLQSQLLAAPSIPANRP